MTLRKTIKRFLANASTLLLVLTDRFEAEAKLVSFRQRRELVEGCADLLGRAVEIANQPSCKRHQPVRLDMSFRCAECASPSVHCPQGAHTTQEHPNGPPDIEPIYQAPSAQTPQEGLSDDGPLDMKDMDELYEIVGSRPMPSMVDMARAWVAAQPA